MTSLPKDEVGRRLSAIQNGPWAAGASTALHQLAPTAAFKVPASGKLGIALDELELSEQDQRLGKRLVRILRPHYEDEKGITSQSEQKTRDALDQALTLPQLYELAVQTGYLPAESVRAPARRILTSLLWSKASRDFVFTYDYLAVPMLAARVGVSGLGPARPPAPQPDASLRFAGFLAHLREFYDDECLETWVKFLDDYIEEEDEQNRLWRYLNGQRRTAPVRAAKLLEGCQLFVASLATAFHVLDDDELGRFGLIHAYWLQKFFGYKVVESGYVKDLDLWGPDDSWARTIAASQHLVLPGTDNEIANVIRRGFTRQVALLERTFEAVRDLARDARRTRAAR